MAKNKTVFKNTISFEEVVFFVYFCENQKPKKQ